MKPSRWLYIALVLLLASFSAVAGGHSSRFGFKMKATVSGFFRPTLEQVDVLKVLSGSPAGSAGLKPGDRILKADGTTIKGAPARDLAAQIRAIKPGGHLRLQVLRDQKVQDIDILAPNE